MRYTIFILIVFTSCSVISQSCIDNGKAYLNYDDIKELLDKNECNKCHFQNSGISNWHYDSYSSLTESGKCDYPVIKHGDAAYSTLYQMLNGKSDVCFSGYKSEHTIDFIDKEKIESWINFGAPENCVPLFLEIKEIFDQHECVSCHNSIIQEGSWYYDSYEKLMTNNEDNCKSYPNVIIYNANQSLLFQKLNKNIEQYCGSKMPINGSSLTEDELDKIRDWINSSAPHSSYSLPVTLEYFKIKMTIDKEVEFEWLTETESNTKEYVIERSHNGFDFYSIGTTSVYGLGSGKYEFKDSDPKIGDNYYRLKIRDFDGRYDYSAIRYSFIKTDNLYFELSPNPILSGEVLNLEWYSKNGIQKTALAEIMDMTGKKIGNYHLNNGVNKIQIPKLTQGLYFLIVHDYYGSAHWERIVII